jgi:hypothetical protein
MLARICFVVAIAAFPLLAGCGGKAEVKKNEGKIDLVAPSSEGAVGAGGATTGVPNGAAPPTPPGATAPPVTVPPGK